MRFLFTKQWYGVAAECQWSVPVGIWPILPMVLLSQPPWARQLPKNIGLSMQVLGELGGINGGRMTAFVDPRSRLPALWNYEAPGIVSLYWRHLLQETRLFDAVVGFAAIRTVRACFDIDSVKMSVSGPGTLN